jgi:hypothetical protein
MSGRSNQPVVGKQFGALLSASQIFRVAPNPSSIGLPSRRSVRDEALLDGGDRLQPLSEIEVQKRLTRVYLTGWDPPATDFVQGRLRRSRCRTTIISWAWSATWSATRCVSGLEVVEPAWLAQW